jgi:uncharacterized protein YdeI (YjbR/CyaY-like superfamily)
MLSHEEHAVITIIDDFFSKGCGRCERFDTPACSAQKWATGLAALRKICRDAHLVETVKWGHPCYVASGRNIAILGALRGEFRLSFFNAALMKDPDRILEKQGPNTQHPDMIRFTDVARVTVLEPIIAAYLAEAMGYAAAGITAPRDTRNLELPIEFVDAMDADPELAEAFHRLTPGRQRSYAIVLQAAKKPETRILRIQKLRPAILAGKGAQER